MEMHTELLTVVVPVLNEENRLAPLTSLLNALRCPVIVVDGGSTDGTYEALRTSAEPHIEVTRTTRGRAVQMNFGASMAETPFLMFLHADTLLPADGVSLAVDVLTNSGSTWGRFDVSFDERALSLRTIAFFMNWRSALTGICTGDQAIFTTARTFGLVGRYKEIALMEDIELSKRLKKTGKPARVHTPVVTAARRWRVNGLVRTILTMWWLRLRYWLGTSPDVLAECYDHAR
jgi:rSAM/selenodomain-associated transferase 2